ncbi:MAG: riboflavin biosynthesis protein RibF [Oscillospiraceae bacterium]|nr:riboflavin biosynthesis protein RibF [Oscillospiraceae bacterium]MBQ9905207.1 riboflavin biosynthesis protein RibF [Oscillospiraceae bacterium]
MKQEMHETQNPARPRIAAALGVFDGVHLGHRRVLAHALAHGACHVVTFAADSMPHKRGKPVRYIYHDEQKRRLLTTCGADAVFALPFTELADLDGEAFCKQILKEQLQVDCVAVGEEFRFGRDAAFDVSHLRHFGEKLGFSVDVVRQVRDDNDIPVSSSHIRFLLESGQIEAANQLLGADYQILAHVVTGQQIGSTVLGIPTANQPFEPWQCIPHRGVYASFAEINDIWVPAITNIGVRPTVTGGDAQPVAETHLIDWSGELEGKLLPVTLCRFIRPEKPFESLDALGAQIRRDIRTRMHFLPADGISAAAQSIPL